MSAGEGRVRIARLVRPRSAPMSAGEAASASLGLFVREALR